MLRIIFVISLPVLLVCCARKDAGTIKSGTRNNNTPLFQANYEQEDSAFDSTLYVGYVDYFADTREFYTTLYYKEGHEYPDEEILETKLDSVIVLDDDWGRERLPMQEARKFLILSGLDTLSIYNRRNKLICRSPLARVEYLWNGLESYFIAVFKSDGKFYEQTGELYGIGSNFSHALVSPFSSEEIHDPVLNEFLIRKLDIDAGATWYMRHYQIHPQQATYSIMSSYSTNSDTGLSYLTALENNKIKILDLEIDNYQFLNILPLPIHVNGRPLILVAAGYPSSDVIWDYLAEYDGKNYEAINYNRVHVSRLSAQ